MKWKAAFIRGVLDASRAFYRNIFLDDDQPVRVAQGNYDVIVTAPGFQKFEAKGVPLDVAQKARVDVNLQVGGAATQIVVEGTNVA